MSHKKFIVMVNYGYEGWHIAGEADTPDQAFRLYEDNRFGLETLVVQLCTLVVIPPGEEQ